MPSSMALNLSPSNDLTEMATLMPLAAISFLLRPAGDGPAMAALNLGATVRRLGMTLGRVPYADRRSLTGDGLT